MIHNKRLIFRLALIALVALAWWGWRRHSPSRTTIKHDGPDALVVGTNVGYPPFILRNEHGSITGFDYDVAAAIAQHLERPLVVKDMSFDALLLALPHGSVDMIIGGISITQARKKKGWMLPYYGDTIDKVSLFYRKDTVPAGISLEQAATSGLQACTQAGTSFEEVIEGFNGIRLKTLGDISDIFLEVNHANSAIGVLDPDTVRVLVRGRDWLGSHEVTLPKHLRIEGFGIGIAPYNSQLREQIKEAVAALHKNGTIAQLAEKWF